jgi:hypothetical protein
VGLGTSVFGEDLVDGRAIQVALLQGVVTVKDEGNVFTIVDVAFSADSPSSSTIGINAFGDVVVEGIVRMSTWRVILPPAVGLTTTRVRRLR